MPKFRKKPVEIEAVPVREVVNTYNDSDTPAVPQWISDAVNAGTLLVYYEGVDIRTLEGVMSGGLNDWIIQGVKGELYPCKRDIFAATYEPAETALSGDDR